MHIQWTGGLVVPESDVVSPEGSRPRLWIRAMKDCVLEVHTKGCCILGRNPQRWGIVLERWNWLM